MTSLRDSLPCCAARGAPTNSSTRAMNAAHCPRRARAACPRARAARCSAARVRGCALFHADATRAAPRALGRFGGGAGPMACGRVRRGRIRRGRIRRGLSLHRGAAHRSGPRDPTVGVSARAPRRRCGVARPREIGVRRRSARRQHGGARRTRCSRGEGTQPPRDARAPYTC